MTAPSCPHGVAWGLGPCEGCREAAGGAQVVPVGQVCPACGGAVQGLACEGCGAVLVWDRRIKGLRVRRRPGRKGRGLVERSVWVEPEVWERWREEARKAGVGVGAWLVLQIKETAQ